VNDYAGATIFGRPTKGAVLAMGFGLLLLGYMTVLGFFPDMSAIYLYIGYALVVPVVGGVIIFAAFLKLQEYNIYFRIMKYIALIYIFMIIAYVPLCMFERDYLVMQLLIRLYRIISIGVLFTFHYIMLLGIRTLASGIDNQRIARSAKINIYFTYIYFGLTIFGFIFISLYYIIAVVIISLVYFVRNALCIYACFVQITYQGHDEELERKLEARANKNIK